MLINNIIKMNYQKQSIEKRSQSMPSGKDWINPNEDPNRNITGSTAHKRIVPVSNNIKNTLIKLSKKAYIDGNGMSDGEEHAKIVNNYLKTVPSEERSATAWTLSRFYIQTSTNFRDKIRETDPNWQPGQSFDKSVLENFQPKYIDVKV